MVTFSALLAICAGNHKGQWRGALMFPLICVWINGWVNNGEASDLRRYQAHYDVTVMSFWTNRPVHFMCFAIPLTKASDAELWCFHWSVPEKKLSKQSIRQWFETPSRSIWRHCYEWLTLFSPLSTQTQRQHWQYSKMMKTQKITMVGIRNGLIILFTMTCDMFILWFCIKKLYLWRCTRYTKRPHHHVYHDQSYGHNMVLPQGLYLWRCTSTDYWCKTITHTYGIQR